MADTLIAVIPDALGPKLTVIVALISMPFTFFMANAPFYFGIIPIMSETFAHFGIPPLEIGQASLLGQPLHLLSPLQGSIYVLVGLLGIDIGDHIRFLCQVCHWNSVSYDDCGCIIWNTIYMNDLWEQKKRELILQNSSLLYI